MITGLKLSEHIDAEPVYLCARVCELGRFPGRTESAIRRSNA
jgi:hypothetical protein